MKIGIFLKNSDESFYLENCFKKYDHHYLQIIQIDSIYTLMKDIFDYQVLIIDIDNPYIHKINQLNKEIKMIYTSHNTDDSIKAFNNARYYFLLLPVKENHIKGLLDQLIKDDKKSIIQVFDIRQILRTINMYDIYFIEINQKISTVHLKNKTFIYTNKSLKSWIDILDGSLFVRSHKSFIINIKYVENIDKEMVVMNNGEKAYISRTYKKEFTQKYYQYIDNIK